MTCCRSLSHLQIQGVISHAAGVVADALALAAAISDEAQQAVVLPSVGRHRRDSRL